VVKRQISSEHLLILQFIGRARLYRYAPVYTEIPNASRLKMNLGH